jgi:hypothetical protein
MSQNKIEVHVTRTTTHERQPSISQIGAWVGAFYMVCLRCGATMRRGEQCERCGAWCR